MKQDGPPVRIRIVLSFLGMLGIVGLLLGSNTTFPKEPAQAYSRGVHETMAVYATGIYGQYYSEPWYSLEIFEYLGDIMAGASNEDEIDHVWNHWGGGGECVTITHFWDPDEGIDDEMWSDSACIGKNAAWKAMILWGMALGQYHIGNKHCAYEYLGHVVHLLGDMSVPAHAHKDAHWAPDTYDDDYMNGDDLDFLPEYLNDDEINGLMAEGMVEIAPALPPLPGLPPLYYLFYMTAQRASRYASDDDDGNTAEYDAWDLVNFGELECPAGCDDEDVIGAGGGCDYTEEGSACQTCMQVIRRNSYFYAIRAIAALYKLFAEQSRQDAELTVAIDSLTNVDSTGSDLPEFFVRVKIGDMWFRNEGEQTDDTCDGCSSDLPLIHGCHGWAFAWNVGLSGTVDVWIELYDDDSTPGVSDYQQWDIYSGANEPEDAEERAIWLTVDLGGCREGTGTAIDYDLTGPCRCQLASVGDDDPDAQIAFRILPPNSPPEANAGLDQTVNEGDLVTLNGAFTDPDPEDMHELLWHLESSTNGQSVQDFPSQSLSFRPCDNGVYTFSFTVTDEHGAWDSDTVVVTAENVPAVVSAPYISNQPNAEFILPVVHEIGFEGTFTDAGTCDTHTAVWDWGDGAMSDAVVSESGGSGTAAASHTYSLPGDYTVTLTVTDDDGDSGSNTMTIHIADADEALDIFDAHIQSLPHSKFRVSMMAKLYKAAFKKMFLRLDLMLAFHNYLGMIYSMNFDIRTKFDGLVGGVSLDDWIKQDRAIQTELCQKVDDITAYLHYLLFFS